MHAHTRLQRRQLFFSHISIYIVYNVPLKGCVFTVVHMTFGKLATVWKSLVVVFSRDVMYGVSAACITSLFGPSPVGKCQTCLRLIYLVLQVCFLYDFIQFLHSTCDNWALPLWHMMQDDGDDASSVVKTLDDRSEGHEFKSRQLGSTGIWTHDLLISTPRPLTLKCSVAISPSAKFH